MTSRTRATGLARLTLLLAMAGLGLAFERMQLGRSATPLLLALLACRLWRACCHLSAPRPLVLPWRLISANSRLASA